jgi:hypothetical protein
LPALTITLFVAQTVTFATGTPFSRCCAIANNPIALLLALIIGIIGCAATAAGVAMSEVCERSNDFAAIYLSPQARFAMLGIERLPAAVFMPDNGLYESLDIIDLVTFKETIPSRFSSVFGFSRIERLYQSFEHLLMNFKTAFRSI